MSSTVIYLRAPLCPASIHSPGESVRAARFSGRTTTPVSSAPSGWPSSAAHRLPPTTQRIAGRGNAVRRRSRPLAGEPPEYRCRRQPDQRCRPVLPVRAPTQSFRHRLWSERHFVIRDTRASAIGSDRITAELSIRRVEVEPHAVAFCFTLRVPIAAPSASDHILNLIPKNRAQALKLPTCIAGCGIISFRALANRVGCA